LKCLQTAMLIHESWCNGNATFTGREQNMGSTTSYRRWGQI